MDSAVRSPTPTRDEAVARVLGYRQRVQSKPRIVRVTRRNANFRQDDGERHRGQQQQETQERERPLSTCAAARRGRLQPMSIGDAESLPHACTDLVTARGRRIAKTGLAALGAAVGQSANASVSLRTMCKALMSSRRAAKRFLPTWFAHVRSISAMTSRAA